jgi:hypothetical protein
VLEHVQSGGAAVGVLHQPPRAQAEPEREVGDVVGRQRERRDAEAVDVAAGDPRALEHAEEPVRQQPLRCRSRWRMP